MSALHRDSLKINCCRFFFVIAVHILFSKCANPLGSFYVTWKLFKSETYLIWSVFLKTHYNCSTDLVKEKCFRSKLFLVVMNSFRLVATVLGASVIFLRVTLDWLCDAVQIKWQNLLFYTVFAPKSDALKVLPGHEICATPGRKKWQEFFD